MNKDAFEYFKEAVIFFNKLQWLYNMPVTKILCKGSLDMFPINWLDSLKYITNNDLNDFVTKFKVKDDWPESLLKFVENCQKMNKLPLTKVSKVMPSLILPEAFLKKLSFKKQNEIFYLAQLIHKQCQNKQISLIVDLGCGLGYICQLLNHLYGYKVLGLESNENNVKIVKSRQKSIFPNSLTFVKFVCFTITNDSLELLEAIIKREFEDSNKICFIGLHACGDLSVFMSKLFLEMEKAKLFVLVSCCYHKLSLKNNNDDVVNDNKEYFNYFPMSKILQKAINYLKIDIGEFFKRPFMRLACQETSDRWFEMTEKTHNEHSFYVLARAVLEIYAVENDLRLRKIVRKATRKSQCADFKSYLEDCTKRYVFEKNNASFTISIPWSDEFKSNLTKLWTNNIIKQKSIELYTALQLLLQNAAESLILLDRLYFFKENKFNAEIVQIVDRSLSPRCYAIVSSK